MTDLSQESLEAVLTAIAKYTQDTGEVITLKPTKLILVKYPDETMQEWQQRCQWAQAVAAEQKGVKK
jgi:hypothetical protein